MRSLVLASILSATALVACGQSLTDNKTGTGGSGSGGSGGSVTGTGGSGLHALCSELVTEYQIAVTASRSCTLGATGQCALPVPAGLSVCGSCPTFVNDDTKPNAIKQQWQDAGCLTAGPPVPCVQELCIAPPSMCIPAPTGAMCASVSGAGGASGNTGAGGGKGTGGTSPDGGANECDALSSKYQTVLAAARTCDRGATGQCGQLVPQWLSVCGGCNVYVNDATALNQIQTAWNQEGCGNNLDVACPAIACLNPAPSSCVAADGGTGTCSITTVNAAAGP